MNERGTDARSGGWAELWNPAPTPAPPGDLGASEMARRIAEYDWAATPLGPRPEWSETLRTSVSLCLHSRFPTALWWGPQLTALYNDAYAVYLGDEKHPEAVGRPYWEVWGELWADVEHLFVEVFRDARAAWSEDQRFTVHRHKYAEEVFFTFSLSPVLDESGRVVGALNVASETTPTVLANRRIDALHRATSASAGAHSVRDAATAITDQLGRHPSDIPFSLLYRIEEGDVHLLGASGLEPGSPVAPVRATLASIPWPVAEAVERGEAISVDVLDGRFPDLPGGPWDASPRQALVLPIARPTLQAALVVGVSPKRGLDDDYEVFLASLGEAIGAALGDAAAQERERSARLEAERANQAKSEFVTAMSHDLRTPLNAIAGYVDLLDAGIHGEITTPQRDVLQRITANQRHLLALINDILLFARLDSAGLEMRREPIQALALIESLEPLIHPQAARRDIAYRPEACDLALGVLGDEERVRQILLNLLGNAVKFTQPGGRVTLTGRPADGGEAVEFLVTDDGPGIPPDRQEVIFDPFIQIGRSLDKPQEGTGLGLAISRTLARAMDGDVTVASEEGRGSTFKVTLPSAPTS